MDIRQIARAVLCAQESHADSWDGTAYVAELEDLFEAACELHGLPTELGRVLYLANMWRNDLHDWAKRVKELEASTQSAFPP